MRNEVSCAEREKTRNRLKLGSNKMAAMLSTKSAEHIASLPKRQGRLELAKELGWQPFDEEEDMQTSVYLEYLYDCFMFAVERGFTWDQVCIVFKHTDELLQQVKDGDMMDCLKVFKLNSFELASILGERNFKIYADFIFSTIMRHFRLIKLVLTQDREKQTPQLLLSVEAPVQPEQLKSGKELAHWEYQQKYEDIQRKEAERANERVSEKEKKVQEAETKQQKTLEGAVNKEQKLNKETLAQIIQEVLGSYTATTLDKLKRDIESTQEDLQFKLEKTSLPRPQALGPPPRYNTKPKTPASPVKQKQKLLPEQPNSKRNGSATSAKSNRSRTGKAGS